VRTNLLLGGAAIGLLITGAIAQTSSNIERIKDPAGHQNTARQAEQKKDVRTIYPNTQNAEQAAQQNRNAQGQADASKRKAGDVTPLPNAQQPTGPAAQPAQTPQQGGQTPATPQSAPAASSEPSTPASTTQTTQSPSPQGTQSAQPSSVPPPTTQQPAPTATAAQPSTPTQPAASQPARASSSSVIALDTQQQSSIGQAIAQRGFKPLTNVSFSIAVGIKVPAAVQLRALPSDLATFVPQYRGYSFVVVEEQIVIVDPGTHEIVAIVPYTAAAPEPRTVETQKSQTPVAEKPMVNRPVNLNTEEKAVSRRPATEQRKKTTHSGVKREVREERAPRAVTIEESGPSRVPVFRSHRYVDDDDDEVVVAPRQNGLFR
jgi:uncharacterized protein DUF1236